MTYHAPKETRGRFEVCVVWLEVELHHLESVDLLLSELFSDVNFVVNLLTSASSGCGCLPGLLSLFVLLVFKCTCLHRLLSLDEFSSHLLGRGDSTLHPRVANQVCHAEALVWERLEHVRDEVFEVLIEEVVSLSRIMVLPEGVPLVFVD